RVAAEGRRRAAVQHALAVELERQADGLDAVERLEESGRSGLLVRGGLGDRLHGRDRDAVEPLEPRRGRLGREALADRRQQRVAVLEPVGVRPEARVLGELRDADALAELREETV